MGRVCRQKGVELNLNKVTKYSHGQDGAPRMYCRNNGMVLCTLGITTSPHGHTGLYNSYQAEIPGRDSVVTEKRPDLASGVFEEKIMAFLGMAEGISMFIAWRNLAKEEMVRPSMGVG